VFAGKERAFNLNSPAVLSAIAGEPFPDRTAQQIILTFGLAPLEGQHGSTPAACLKRFLEQTYSTKDIEVVIGLGLIGGGADVQTACELVKDHVTGKPLAPNALIASEVITALFVGQEEAA
jgi:hypothetical protein